MTRKIWNRSSLLCAMTSLFFFGVTATEAWSQTYNVGDRVEVDDTGMNSWIGGVVMPFKPGDTRDGVYRVKRDPPYLSRDPAGEYAQVIHMRPSSAAAPSTAASSSSSSGGSYGGASSSGSSSARPYTSSARPYSAPARTNAAPAGAASTDMLPDAKASSSNLNPPMAGGLPKIPGTGWMIMGIQKKGEAPKTPKSFGQSLSFCFSGSWSNTRYDLAAGPMGTYTVQGSRLNMISSLDNSVYLSGPMTWRAADQMLIVDSGTYYWYLQLTSLNACGGK